MPLFLVCKCTHSAPLPDQSGSYKCTKCGNKITLTYFRSPNAWGQFEKWKLTEGKDLEPVRIEYRAEPANVPA